MVNYLDAVDSVFSRLHLLFNRYINHLFTVLAVHSETKASLLSSKTDIFLHGD